MYIHIIQTLAKFAKHRNIDLAELRQLRLQTQFAIFTEKSCRATFAQQKCKKCLRNHFGSTSFQTPRTTREMKII